MLLLTGRRTGTRLTGERGGSTLLALRGSRTSTLYYYDPIALTYAWSHLWIQWVSTLYYLEFFKTMMETWRRMLESTLRAVPAAPASATA
jgi:hypothetical protein